MATYSIDTAAAIERLEGTGLPHDQAQAIVGTFAETHEQLATKADITAVKADITALKSEMSVLKAQLSLRIYLMAGAVVAALKLLEYLGI